MNRLIATATLALCLYPSAARAGTTLKPDYPICVSDELLTQFEKAVIDRDIDAVTWLAGHGCSLTTAGTHITVLELTDGEFRAHIRAYRGSLAAEGWTLSDAIVKNP
jgi:hypothetical protein